MTDEIELENKKEEIKMPWQGKVCLFLIFLNLFLGIIGFFVLFFYESSNFLLILFLIFFTFYLFLIIGFLKGWLWSIKVIFVLSCFGLLSNIKDIFKESLSMDFNLTDFLIDLFFLFYSVFFLYLVWFCVKHPYFNQKKIKN